MAFPKTIIIDNSIYDLNVRNVDDDRASTRDLVDFRMDLRHRATSQRISAVVGATVELAGDCPDLDPGVPLGWLIARFLSHHVRNGSVKQLSVKDGPVLTSENYVDYLGEAIGPEHADDAVLHALQTRLLEGVDADVTLAELFAATNLDLATLKRSINAHIARRLIQQQDEQCYRLNSERVIDAKTQGSGRAYEPTPASLYHQEIKIEANPPFCFVMMPFREEEFPQRLYYEVMKPVLTQEFGITCYRVNEDHLPDRIDNKIYTYILRADFVVAEVSTRNPNVMYELGFAHALNKRCIILTQNAPKDLPFDVNRFSVDPYDSDDALRAYLRRVIGAIRGAR